MLRRLCSEKTGSNSLSASPRRRKPCVILTDILKTKKGKSYLERLKPNHTLGDRGQVSSPRKEHVQREEESVICRDRKSSPRVTNNDKNKNATPKGNMKTTLSSSQRWGVTVKGQLWHRGFFFFKRTAGFLPLSSLVLFTWVNNIWPANCMHDAPTVFFCFKLPTEVGTLNVYGGQRCFTSSHVL